MWWIAFIIIGIIIAAIVIVVFIRNVNEKNMADALSNSPRIAKIKEINARYEFKTFKNNFDYIVHFTDLDEFKTSDINLIKYSFLVKNRSKIKESLQCLNENIQTYKTYIDEINAVKELDDRQFIEDYKINLNVFRKRESEKISSILKKATLKCSFNVYYDYTSPTGRSNKESEHFSLDVVNAVDIDLFLKETFPEVNISDYHFKPHYLNQHHYIHNNLLVTEETENLIKEINRREQEAEKECREFYSGKNIYYTSNLTRAIDHFQKAQQELLDYLNNLGLRYLLVKSNKYEFFIIVEESSYIYVAHISNGKPVSLSDAQITDAYTMAVELNYNPFFNFKTPINKEPNFLYYKYLTFSNYSTLEMSIERCKTLMPEIDIDRINKEWEGLPCSFIIYEINLSGRYGYSLLISENIEDSVAIGRRKIKNLLYYEKDRATKQKKMEIDKGNLDDMYTYDLSCSADFLSLLKQVKEEVRKGRMNKKGDSTEERVLSQIVYCVVPFFLKDKTRESIKKVKEKELSILDHEQLLKFDSYSYINSHKKWKNEYSLYELCKKLYGAQVIYQYRPSFLKTEKGQLSYDIYLSKLHVAIEYQGKQHFQPIVFFGGKEAYDDLRRRDLLKKKLSNENGIKLIEITYKDAITSELLKKKIEG